jgi:hypothetical protein
MAVNINCLTTGTISANGTAEMEVLTMHTVALNTPNATFAVDADAFQYFSLAEEASGNSTAEFTVSIANVAGLKTALGGWLKGSALNSSQDVETWMIEYLRGEINALVGQDGVGAALQGSVIKNLAFESYDDDAQAGADGLVDALEADQHAKDLIGLQFPPARFISGSSEAFSSSLPAQIGDSLTFEFTISSTITVTDDVVDSVNPNPSGATNNTTGNPTVGSTLDVSKSRIVHIVATKAA